MVSDPYNDWFFEQQAHESRESAAALVPLLLSLSPTRSVLDVGGGVGAWAAAFAAAGVADVLSVDGDYVDRDALLLPPDDFRAHDLTTPLDLKRRYDLVLCLEVAEHLPEASASTLLATLERHGDLIVFSAAVPGQGGQDHVNEQWQSYWRDRFVALGFKAFDIIRPQVWNDARIGYWFRQNLIVYARGSAADRLPAIRTSTLDVVHPETWRARLDELATPPTIRESATYLAAGIRRRLSR